MACSSCKKKGSNPTELRYSHFDSIWRSDATIGDQQWRPQPRRVRKQRPRHDFCPRMMPDRNCQPNCSTATSAVSGDQMPRLGMGNGTVTNQLLCDSYPHIVTKQELQNDSLQTHHAEGPNGGKRSRRTPVVSPEHARRSPDESAQANHKLSVRPGITVIPLSKHSVFQTSQSPT